MSTVAVALAILASLLLLVSVIRKFTSCPHSFLGFHSWEYARFDDVDQKAFSQVAIGMRQCRHCQTTHVIHRRSMYDGGVVDTYVEAQPEHFEHLIYQEENEECCNKS